jgi:hypothetical protein
MKTSIASIEASGFADANPQSSGRVMARERERRRHPGRAAAAFVWFASLPLATMARV